MNLNAHSPDSCSSRACLVSPAKLNLSLRVVGRRADGYHRIQSVFWPISFGDEITVEKSEVASHISFSWANDAPRVDPLPQTRENTVACVLKEAESWGFPSHKISVTKRIPMGGGLGGGSSNAGALLRFIRSARPEWAERLLELAVRVGADVPFFLVQRPAMVTGIGEEILPLTVAASVTEGLRFLLVIPPSPTSTATVFQHLRESGFQFSDPEPFFSSEKSLDQAAFTQWLRTARNDLERPARRYSPLVGEIIDALRQTRCLYAGLSGSGSTCFAVYDSDATLLGASKDLQHFCRKNDCRSINAQTLMSV